MQIYSGKKKIICAQYLACLSLCQENYYEWGMNGMKFCIIHDYGLLNFIEESLSTPDVPGATKRSCVPHCWSENGNRHPAVVTSATWLFVSKIREINLKKMIEKIHRPLNCRHWLQVERGGGIYYIRYLCNNWKSVSAFCFLLTKFNLATLCMWCCCHCFSSCLSHIVWHVTECSQAVKHSYFSLTPLENIFIEK